MIQALAGVARVAISVGRAGSAAARTGGSVARAATSAGARTAVSEMTRGALSHTQAGSRQVPPDEYDDRNRF